MEGRFEGSGCGLVRDLRVWEAVVGECWSRFGGRSIGGGDLGRSLDVVVVLKVDRTLLWRLLSMRETLVG